MYGFLSQPGNVIPNEYVTIRCTTANNGDLTVTVEILRPENIEIDEWHFTVRDDNAVQIGETQSGDKAGIYYYVIPNLPAQKIHVFLTIGAHDIYLNDYFTDNWVKTWDHKPISLDIVTTTEDTGEGEEGFMGFTPGFEIAVGLVGLFIIVRRSRHEKK